MGTIRKSVWIQKWILAFFVACFISSILSVSVLAEEGKTEVVGKLYDLVPDALHGIITKEMISEIVQSTFDEIEEYVKIQLDNGIDKINVKGD